MSIAMVIHHIACSRIKIERYPIFVPSDFGFGRGVHGTNDFGLITLPSMDEGFFLLNFRFVCNNDDGDY